MLTALRAGYQPKNTPMAELNANASPTEASATEIYQCSTWAATSPA